MMNDFILILSYILIWFVIMFLPSYAFSKFPKSVFKPESFLFKERKWELGGKLYEKVFFIRKWKDLLPDGSKAFKNGFQKKHIISYKKEYLYEFVLESCRAEAAHIPPIFLSLIFSIYNPPSIAIIMFVFGLVSNLPCIISQRYNRIRFKRLLIKMNK